MIRPDFVPFPKIARLLRDAVITEKIDGTNASITITEAADVFPASRTRWLTIGDDNFGFAAWVEANRQRVHAATAGRVGYVHIPDMGPRGYAEFHRGYLAEVAREALHWLVEARQSAKRGRTLVLSNLSAVDIRKRFNDGTYDSRTESRLRPLLARRQDGAGIFEVVGEDLRGAPV